MTTLTRWKLACALFAGIAGYATVSANHSAPANVQAVGVASPKGAAIPSHLRRPLRISAEAAGISRDELVDRALSARALRDLVTITDKLGAVGNDQTVDQLRPCSTTRVVASPRRCSASTADRERARCRCAALLHQRRPPDASAPRRSARSAPPRAARPSSSCSTSPRSVADPAQTTRDQRARHARQRPRGRGADPAREQHRLRPRARAVSALGNISTAAASIALRKLIDVAGPADRRRRAVVDRHRRRAARPARRDRPDRRSAARQRRARALGHAGEAGCRCCTRPRSTAPRSTRWRGGQRDRRDRRTRGDQDARRDPRRPATGSRHRRGRGAAREPRRPEARELLIEAALSDRAQITGALAQLAQLARRRHRRRR